jgi:hypothetical protein
MDLNALYAAIRTTNAVIGYVTFGPAQACASDDLSASGKMGSRNYIPCQESICTP